jgi:FemAB-related protein (PEP-CTERM system-associated)
MGVQPACRVVTLASRRRADWEEYVRRHPQGTVFHTLAWHDAVAESFPHEDVYLLAYQGERVAGVLPMFMVNSLLCGRMLVSLPYAVGGGILADHEETADFLFDRAREIAAQRDCATIDLRSERATLPRLAVMERYVGFERRLPSRVEEILSWLPRKARAAARNARSKFGLIASFGDEHLPEVWRLYCKSMKRLGSLAYRYAFFERLAAHTPDAHWTCIVRWNGRTVAGLFTLLFRDRVMPYFVGTTAPARKCSAANFIYLATMERAVEEGYRVFDFGRSRRDNSGSYDFKRFQGFEPRPLEYQRHSTSARALELTPANPVFRLARRVFRRLPLPVTRMVGARLADHIPG